MLDYQQLFRKGAPASRAGVRPGKNEYMYNLKDTSCNRQANQRQGRKNIDNSSGTAKAENS